MKQNTMMTVGGLLLCGVAQVASAHISLERGGTHLSRHGDGQDDLKDGPCGRAGAAGQRGTNIYTYRPGETITVTFSEYIPHPGYFRFAFDNDGDDAFVDPVSILPIDPMRGCPYTPSAIDTDRCNASDFYNNDAVLPGMDNLDPHISTLLSPPKLWTYQVTLPNVECNNCTLQVIQVMEDPLGHGPFDGHLDVYHQCIDLVLTNAGGSGGAGGSTAGTGGGASGTGGVGGEGGVGMAGAAGDGVGGTGAGGASGTGAGGTGGTAGTGAGMSGAGGTGFGGFGGGAMKDDSGCSVTDGRTNTGLFAPLLLGVSLILMRRRRDA